MNAEHAMRELELAAWELAEAETCERKARKMREDASRRLASVYSEMKLAIATAKLKNLNNQTNAKTKN